MKIKALTFSILIMSSIFQSISCIELNKIDFATAEPKEIAHAIASHSVKAIVTKVLDTGLYNIPYENLEQLVTHKQIAWEILDRMENDADNFISLSKWEESSCIIAKIIELYPASTKLFIQLAVDNFIALTKTDFGYMTLEIIMEECPESRKLFAQLAVDNFMIVANGMHCGCWAIDTIIKLYPESAKQFTQLTVDHFTSLANTNEGRMTINSIMEVYPESAKQFAQVAFDNYALLADTYGSKIIVKIMKLYPQSAQQLDKDAINKISKLASKDCYCCDQ